MQGVSARASMWFASWGKSKNHQPDLPQKAVRCSTGRLNILWRGVCAVRRRDWQNDSRKDHFNELEFNPTIWNRDGTANSASPLPSGEVGARSAPGEGLHINDRAKPPHPNPLPASGEREHTAVAATALTQSNLVLAVSPPNHLSRLTEPRILL